MGTLRFRAGGPFEAIAYSPNGKLLAAAETSAGRVHVWDAASGRKLRIFHWPISQVKGLAFAADGKLLAAASTDGKCRLWDVPDVGPATGRQAVGGVIALAPDGRSLALGDNDGSVRVLETITGNERLRFVGHRGAVKTVAFTPDGTRLASGSVDTTVLLWDLIDATSAERPRVLSDDEVRRRWAKLAGADAAAAYKAMLDLSAAPQSALTLLSRQLRPVAASDAEQLARWLADLDAPSFAVRERASAELAKLGDRVAPALRAALAGQPSPEAHRRLKALLERVVGPVRSPEELQALRGLEVLEHIGNRQARDLLHTIANGFAESRQTQSAKGALERLGKRPVGPRK